MRLSLTAIATVPSSLARSPKSDDWQVELSRRWKAIAHTRVLPRCSVPDIGRECQVVEGLLSQYLQIARQEKSLHKSRIPRKEPHNSLKQKVELLAIETINVLALYLPQTL